MSGLISLCIGPIGLYLSTYLTETLQKRGFKDASLRVPIIGYLCGAPAALRRAADAVTLSGAGIAAGSAR